MFNVQVRFFMFFSPSLLSISGLQDKNLISFILSFYGFCKTQVDTLWLRFMKFESEVGFRPCYFKFPNFNLHTVSCTQIFNSFAYNCEKI